MNTKKHQTNEQRTLKTRQALLVAARTLFVEKGYGETGTPEIVKSAKVTRGALYHHFADKAALFEAVLLAEAESVAEHIHVQAQTAEAPLDALLEGAQAYFSAMTVSGRARLLLLEGPAILGQAVMLRIDQATGASELKQGLMYALNAVEPSKLPLDELTEILSAGFDRAALSIAQGQPSKRYETALRLLLSGLIISCD